MTYISIGPIRFLRQTYQIMESLFIRKWSANRVQAYMTGIGSGVRRSSVQLVRRHVLDLVKKQNLVERMAANLRPSRYHLVEETWADPHRYTIYGSQTVFDPDTGLEVTSPWQVYFDNLPTKEEGLARLYEMHILGDSKPGTTIIHAEVLQIRHRRGASY